MYDIYIQPPTYVCNTMQQKKYMNYLHFAEMDEGSRKQILWKTCKTIKDISVNYLYEAIVVYTE